MKGKTYPRHETREQQVARLAIAWKEFKEKHKNEPREPRRQINSNRHYHTFLPMFWRKFKSLRTMEGKLALLKEMSKLEIPNHVPYRLRRSHKIPRSRRKWICQVCHGKAYHVHHIIQVQNGGKNKKGNLIELCEKCHGAIHPWMIPDIAPPTMQDTMARVERET
jgi:hypothetical protein